jgi:hypothetical protein
VKQPFENRIEQLSHDFLRDPIANGGNTQRAFLAGLFINVPPEEGVRAVGTILELPHQSPQIFAKVILKHLDAHLVDACLASIAFHAFEGATHEA